MSLCQVGSSETKSGHGLTVHSLSTTIAMENFFRVLEVPSTHEITKYGIHSFMQITLAVDKELIYN